VKFLEELIKECDRWVLSKVILELKFPPQPESEKQKEDSDEKKDENRSEDH